MERSELEKRNYNGQLPTNKPTKELITPRRKTDRPKDQKSNFKTTGKDYKHSDRQTTR